MSVDGSSSDSKQISQIRTMPATTQNAHEEIKPAIPVFSYAQAAKGKPLPAQTSSNSSKSLPEVAGFDVRKKSDLETVKSSADSIGAGSHHVRIMDSPQADFAPKSTSEMQTERGDGRNDSGKMQTPATNSTLEPHETGHLSEFATNKVTSGASSIEKRDKEGSLPLAAPTETEGETAASNQQNESKSDELESTQNMENSWGEEKSGANPFKEAPPPTVNFWAQRMAQIPKTKVDQSSSSVQTKPAAMTNGLSPATNEAPKVAENHTDSKIRETKKKPRHIPEDKLSAKDSTRSLEAKVKSGDGQSDAIALSYDVLTFEGSSKSTVGSMAPPPPGDAISWPTPDSAAEEEKKKLQDKPDKERAQSTKTHGKKEWQAVPFVPTVAFNTPLPQARRGGRPSAGARESTRGRNGGAGEKTTSTGASPTSQTPLEDRSKGAFGSSTPIPNSQKPKRASSAGPATPREQRRAGEHGLGERRRDLENIQSRGPPNKTPSQSEHRRQSATAVNELQSGRPSIGRPAVRDTMVVPKKSQSNGIEDERANIGNGSNSQTPRTTENDRKGEAFGKSSEGHKDSQSNLPARDRGEGRSRGGFRGRGGGNQNIHSNSFVNGHGFSGPYPSSQYQTAPGGQPRSFSNHERLASQPPGPFFPPGPPHARTHRSNSRSQSIPHPYGRYSQAGLGGPNHLAHLQTDLANNYAFQPEPQGPMSAMPFNPYMAGPNLFGMVTVQMEYYFSVDNLCKDTYLRSHMNSQGFVSLNLVAGFRRIQQLTPDLELVRYVCLNSQVIEFRVGEDGTDWVRRRDDWQQWVLNAEDRVSSARNDGPVPAAPFQTPQVYNSPTPLDERQDTSPRLNAATAPIDNIQHQSLENNTHTLNQVVTVPAPPPDGLHSNNRAPLSAAVSEFSPSVRSSSNRVFSSPDLHSQGTNIISDDEMEKLNITFRAKPADVTAPVLPPFHSTSSRTFSNGSIDGSAISSELSKFAEQSSASLNGDVSERYEPL